jgi:NTE family protein
MDDVFHESYRKAIMIPYRIYLSGGGMCAMAHVGALQALNKRVPLTTVKEWMGVSAGSFVAMCMGIGYSLEDMADLCLRFDFTEIKDTDSVPGWILHWGMDTGERLKKLIDACLHIKGLSSDLTFQQFTEQFHCSLRIVATDLNDATAITFSPEDSPTYRISDAVRASMTVPYYFQPFICPISGHHLVDGGVISNYPLFVLPKEEHIRTLSIIIRTSVEKKELLEDLPMDQLLMRPLNITIVEKASIESRFYDAGCISIPLGEINIVDFALDMETKAMIIKKGKKAVEDFYQEKPKRRRSIS